MTVSIRAHSPEGPNLGLLRQAPSVVLWMVLATILFFLLTAERGAAAPRGLQIKKVLAHLLDTNGVHTTSPSLLERDAYQAELRRDSARRGGLQFDILLSTLPEGLDLTLRIEAQGSYSQKATTLKLEKHLARGDRFRRWQALAVKGGDYQAFGELVAWRATLWHGESLLAEQKSFLW